MIFGFGSILIFCGLKLFFSTAFFSQLRHFRWEWRAESPQSRGIEAFLGWVFLLYQILVPYPHHLIFWICRWSTDKNAVFSQKCRFSAVAIPPSRFPVPTAPLPAATGCLVSASKSPLLYLRSSNPRRIRILLFQGDFFHSVLHFTVYRTNRPESSFKLETESMRQVPYLVG